VTHTSRYAKGPGPTTWSIDVAVTDERSDLAEKEPSPLEARTIQLTGRLELAVRRPFAADRPRGAERRRRRTDPVPCARRASSGAALTATAVIGDRVLLVTQSR
jgi:hypothetical protein